MTSYEPQDESTIRFIADLEDPSLSELSTFFLGIQDVLYVGGLLDGRDRFSYTVADRFSPELADLTKLSRSFHVRTLRMASPLLVEIVAWGSSMLSLGYGALRFWDKLTTTRLNHSRARLEMEINKQLQHELSDVNTYYSGFARRFDEKGLDIRNPVEAEENAAKTLSQMHHFEIESPEARPHY